MHADLLLVAKVQRSEKRLVIVANRARRYTKAYHSLMKFLQSLRIPVAAVLRDSQVYVRSAETGTGLHEMKGALLQEDLDTFRPMIEWLERRSFSLVPTEDTPAADAEAEGAQVVPTIAPVILDCAGDVDCTCSCDRAGPGAVPAPVVPRRSATTGRGVRLIDAVQLIQFAATGRFETASAPFVCSDASSATVNVTSVGRPSLSFALPTCTTKGRSRVQSM